MLRSALMTISSTTVTLSITGQDQQRPNWCWAATGNSIAAYYGYSYPQNQFCNMAFGNALNATCPNNQATQAAVVVQQDAVAVYALNPAFVAGKSGEVASLWYVATTATKGSATLTVFTAPDPATGSWQERSGDIVWLVGGAAAIVLAAALVLHRRRRFPH
ncbi:hypothetical protein GCM10009789_46780 [Kribbella sancticallisti]|uniref:Uncharacterized protein n=2 Tax=Kribbella sancticallisti TaxID=460087 RepID=A0ABN2DX04_9ACTN